MGGNILDITFNILNKLKEKIEDFFNAYISHTPYFKHFFFAKVIHPTGVSYQEIKQLD